MAPKPPVWARRLGYAGLLPFVCLSLATWYFQDALRLQLAHALLTYAATIASFLGAIHWGLAMRGAEAPDQTTSLLLWGVTPCLLAWVALLVPLGVGLWGLAVLLWVCYGVDLRVYPRLGVPEWLAMRAVLTKVASACCVIGALAG
jgi:hypothetical protein